MRTLITAGPTWEPIDAVRYIGNRSSGATGLAIARAAFDAGHEVTLLHGPGVRPDLPERIRTQAFETTADLQSALATCFPEHDLLVMAAAVADYRPARVIDGKIARRDRSEGAWTIDLEPTPDLVAALADARRDDQRIVAFALESPASLPHRARSKLKRKKVDAIVANPLATMGADRITAIWIGADGRTDEPGALDKSAFGPWLVRRMESLF